MTDTTDTPTPTVAERAHQAITEYLGRELPNVVPHEGIAADIVAFLTSDNLLAHDGRCFRLPEGVDAGVEGDVVTFRMADPGPLVPDRPKLERYRGESVVVQVPPVIGPTGEPDNELTMCTVIAAAMHDLLPEVRERVAMWAAGRWAGLRAGD